MTASVVLLLMYIHKITSLLLKYSALKTAQGHTGTHTFQYYLEKLHLIYTYLLFTLKYTKHSLEIVHIAAYYGSHETNSTIILVSMYRHFTWMHRNAFVNSWAYFKPVTQYRPEWTFGLRIRISVMHEGRSYIASLECQNILICNVNLAESKNHKPRSQRGFTCIP